MPFTFKDNINQMLHSNLGYYGKTKRHFKVRVCEHLGITILTGKKIKSPKKSAVFDHIFHTSHKASCFDFEILVKDSDEFRLLL